jgi:hypothetical protein
MLRTALAPLAVALPLGPNAFTAGAASGRREVRYGLRGTRRIAARPIGVSMP